MTVRVSRTRAVSGTEYVSRRPRGHAQLARNAVLYRNRPYKNRRRYVSVTTPCSQKSESSASPPVNNRGFMRFHAQRCPLGGTGGPLHGCRRSRGPRSVVTPVKKKREGDFHQKIAVRRADWKRREPPPTRAARPDPSPAHRATPSHRSRLTNRHARGAHVLTPLAAAAAHTPCPSPELSAPSPLASPEHTRFVTPHIPKRPAPRLFMFNPFYVCVTGSTLLLPCPRRKL